MRMAKSETNPDFDMRISSLQPIPFPLAIQRTRINAEYGGRLLHGRGGGEDAADVLGLKFLQGKGPTDLEGAARQRCADLGWQVRQSDLRRRRQNDAAFDGVAQLANV